MFGRSHAAVLVMCTLIRRTVPLAGYFVRADVDTGIKPPDIRDTAVIGRSAAARTAHHMPFRQTGPPLCFSSSRAPCLCYRRRHHR